MIVCHCQVVSDRRIRDAVAAGAASVEDVGDRCGAGTGCGGCRPSIGTLLATVTGGEPVEPAA
ncbi:MAG TPA: (2Fe-2S)-binding protein [Acidimicrobiales bacterium]|nr:(2Fe-2S)-binding protein [Acidimicrobiales bacterium]